MKRMFRVEEGKWKKIRGAGGLWGVAGIFFLFGLRAGGGRLLVLSIGCDQNAGQCGNGRFSLDTQDAEGVGGVQLKVARCMAVTLPTNIWAQLLVQPRQRNIENVIEFGWRCIGRDPLQQVRYRVGSNVADSYIGFFVFDRRIVGISTNPKAQRMAAVAGFGVMAIERDASD